MFLRFLTVLVVLAIGAGCSTSPNGEVVAEDLPEDRQVAVAGPTEAAEPPLPAPILPDVPPEAFQPELLPEDLEGKLGLSGYRFDRDPDGGGTVRLSLVNLQGGEPLSLELSSLFQDAQGRAVRQSGWTRVTIQPEQRHLHTAQLSDPRVRGAVVLIRQLVAEER